MRICPLEIRGRDVALHDFKEELARTGTRLIAACDTVTDGNRYFVFTYVGRTLYFSVIGVRRRIVEIVFYYRIFDLELRAFFVLIYPRFSDVRHAGVRELFAGHFLAAAVRKYKVHNEQVLIFADYELESERRVDFVHYDELMVSGIVDAAARTVFEYRRNAVSDRLSELLREFFYDFPGAVRIEFLVLILDHFVACYEHRNVEYL